MRRAVRETQLGMSCNYVSYRSMQLAPHCNVVLGSGGGESVQVEGSFDGWKKREDMVKSGKNFQLVKLLPPGIYQVGAILL